MTEIEFNMLMSLLLKLQEISENANIKRGSKSLFNLLSKQRYSTESDLSSIKF